MLSSDKVDVQLELVLPHDELPGQPVGLRLLHREKNVRNGRSERFINVSCRLIPFFDFELIRL